MVQISDSETAFKHVENALSSETFAVPFMNALQAFVLKENRLPYEIDGKDHLDDIGSRCMAHDALLYLKELNEKGIENIHDPVNQIEKIIFLTQCTSDFRRPDIDVAELKKKVSEAHRIMARRILKDFSEGRLADRDIPLAYNSFMNHYSEASNDIEPFPLTYDDAFQIMVLTQESVNKAPVLAKALYASLPSYCRGEAGMGVSEEIAKRTSRGMQHLRM